MEVVGGVASVTTVVSLALESIKAIYEVTRSIRHGADDIGRLVKATSNLEELLEVTKRLAEHAQRTNSVAKGKLLEDLKPLVDNCDVALRHIHSKLDHLQKDSKDGRLKKVKKYAKVYLDNKGVKEIWDLVNHYVGLLGSHLGNASLDVGLSNAQKLDSLHSEPSAASRDKNSELFRVEEILRDQRALYQADLDALQASIHQGSLDARAAEDIQVQGIADIRKDFQDVRAIIDAKSHQACLKSGDIITEIQEGISRATTTSSMQAEENRRMNVEITQKLHSIYSRLDTLPTIASEQLSTLQSLVNMLSDIQLGLQTDPQESQTRMRSRVFHTNHEMRNDLEMTADPELRKTMARLSESAGNIIACRYSKEAQSVIEDIGRLLGLVMQHISATNLKRDDLPRKRKTLSRYQYSKLESAVRSMESVEEAKRVLTASKRLRTSNQDVRELEKSDRSAALLRSYSARTKAKNARWKSSQHANLQSIVRSWALEHCSVSAIFRTIILPDAEDRDTESADEAFEAKLLITPISALESGFQIVIDLASETYQNCTTYLLPTLTFRAIIPDDSEVFRIVKGGSVKKLKKLLSSGAASLKDCDTMGRSLLNFALFRSRRRMTKFLIQSGADVDTLEMQFGSYDSLVKPLSMISYLLSIWESSKTEECYKSLVDAGSDISSVMKTVRRSKDEETSAFHQTIFGGTPAQMKALIDLGEPFISLECTGSNTSRETIPLLLLAFNHSDYGAFEWILTRIPDKVALLLSRGANARATNSIGETCLHLVFSGHDHGKRKWWYPDGDKRRRYQCRTKDIVILMITAGADVCAIDESGRSVSDNAVHSGKQTLWTEALRYCGIDIQDVLVRPHANTARSTALSPEYSERSRSVTSKVSLEEYLERRKAFHVPGVETWAAQSDDSDDDDGEDEELDSELSSSKGYNKDEDEYLAEDMTETVETGEQTSHDESIEGPVQCEDTTGRGKTKLD